MSDRIDYLFVHRNFLINLKDIVFITPISFLPGLTAYEDTIIYTKQNSFKVMTNSYTHNNLLRVIVEKQYQLGFYIDTDGLVINMEYLEASTFNENVGFLHMRNGQTYEINKDTYTNIIQDITDRMKECSYDLPNT